MQQEDIIYQYRKEFDKILDNDIKKGNLEYDDNIKNAVDIFEFSRTNSGKGKIVYRSFSDFELCELLRVKARELGYVPAQKEMHWLYRIYIKRRFGNWPRALVAAGLSKKAGKCGDSYEKIKKNKLIEREMFEQLKVKARELGRPPHMHEMKEMAEIFKYKYITWAEVLEAAGVDNQWKNWEPVYQVKDLSEEDKKMLQGIYAVAVELGRAPMRTEINPEIREKLKNSCGTWRNILYQINLEPIQKIKPFSITYLDGRRNIDLKHNDILERSFFKLVEPNEETLNQIKQLNKMVKELGRAPIKAEIPKEMYCNLIKQCVSYRNILYQVGVEPVEKVLEKEIAKELRRKAR